MFGDSDGTVAVVVGADRMFGNAGNDTLRGEGGADFIDGGWQVVPNTAAPNETLLNGRKIDGTTPLSTGDVLAVGREAKGIVKLPLEVRF